MPGTHLGGRNFEFTMCSGEVRREMLENTRFLTFCKKNYSLNIRRDIVRVSDLEVSRRGHSIGIIGGGRLLIMGDRETDYSDFGHFR